MMTDQDTGTLLRAGLERRARLGQVGDLATSVAGATRGTPQARGVLGGIPRFGTSSGRLLVAVWLIGSLALGTALVAGRPPIVTDGDHATPAPVPSQGSWVPGVENALLVRPFTYDPAAAAGAIRTQDAPERFAWTWGPSPADLAADPVYGRNEENGVPLTGSWGVLVAVLPWPNAVTHPCPQPENGGSRVEIPSGVDEIVASLSSVGGMAFGPPTATTLDGRPATSLDNDPAHDRCGTADVHLTSTFVMLTLPSRLWVTDVKGRTVMIQLWGATRADVDRHLTDGQRLIDSLRFSADVLPPPPTPSAP